MAQNRSVCWTIRPSGLETNGGGFDPFLASAGTDYTNQDAPQLALTDMSSSGVAATFSTVAGGLTAGMIGNSFRIASGTNATTGYYTLIAVADTNNGTLDRNWCSGAVSGNGVGKLGGAFPSFKPFASAATGGMGTAILTTPLQAGQTCYIYLGGAGYDWSAGHWTIPNGTLADGIISIIGFGGSAIIEHDWALACDYVTTRGLNLKRKVGSNLTIPFVSIASGISYWSSAWCVFDQAGFDTTEFINSGGGAEGNEFKNSGGGSAGSNTIAVIDHPSSLFHGNYMHGLRGPAVSTGVGSGSTSVANITNNLIVNNLSHGIVVFPTASEYYYGVRNNTVAYNGGDGIRLMSGAFCASAVFNNITAFNTGYGMYCEDSIHVNRRIRRSVIDYNCNYGNTAGNFNQVGGEDSWYLQKHDIPADPVFINAGALDFRAGPAVRGKGYSGLGWGPSGTIGAATNTLNIGVYQVKTPPSSPTIGTATKGNASASVAFTASVDDGGSAITGYTATSTPGGFTGSGASSPITVGGLTNGTSYTFTVHATNAIGNSAESSASNAVTPSTVPSAPTIGTAAVVDATHVNVPFTAGANGGSTITSYTATSSPGGFTGTLSQAGSGTVSVNAAFVLSQAYTFTVHATNANGNSSESSASNSVTPNTSVATIAVTLKDIGNLPLANLTGLDWAWCDQPRLKDQLAPTDKGSGASTNGAALFSVTTLPGSALTTGQQGRLSVSTANGVTVASGPITIL